MLKTLWATVRQGKIELLEPVELPEGTRVMVTLLPDNETEFWVQTSQVSLDAVWDNTEDDVYAQLLEKWHHLGSVSFFGFVQFKGKTRSCCECAAPVSRYFYHSTNEQNYIVTWWRVCAFWMVSSRFEGANSSQTWLIHSTSKFGCRNHR